MDPLDNIPQLEHANMILYETDINIVENIICQLKDVGAGIDSINSKILKNTYKSILPHLVHLFNICLKKECFQNL